MNISLMLVHRLRRWTNIKLALGLRFVFAGMWSVVVGYRIIYLLTENMFALYGYYM